MKQRVIDEKVVPEEYLRRMIKAYSRLGYYVEVTIENIKRLPLAGNIVEYRIKVITIGDDDDEET